MEISKIIIVYLYFFFFWLAMVGDKEIERSRVKWAERRADLLEKFWKDEENKRMELQTKYDNVERELKARDKQYLELLERMNKNG